MKFDKILRTQIEAMSPAWREHFLAYKHLKKRLKLVIASLNDAHRLGQKMTMSEENGFKQMLNLEVSRCNSFYVWKEEDCVMEHYELKQAIRDLVSRCSMRERVMECATCGGQAARLLRRLILFRGELFLLQNYSILNWLGLTKILKKHDKRTGLLLRAPYLHAAIRQPFCTTEVTGKLIRSCNELLQTMGATDDVGGGPSEGRVDETDAGVASHTADDDCLETVDSTISAVRTAGRADQEAAEKPEKDRDLKRDIMAAIRCLDAIAHSFSCSSVPADSPSR